MSVRPTQDSDLVVLAEYWYDREVMLQQFQPVIAHQLLDQSVWRTMMYHWLNRQDTLAFTLEIDDCITGAILGQIEQYALGLDLQPVGYIKLLILDLHTNGHHGGPRRLYETLSNAMIQQGVKTVWVDVPVQHAVEQAFWLGMGGRRLFDRFRISL